MSARHAATAVVLVGAIAAGCQSGSNAPVAVVNGGGTGNGLHGAVLQPPTREPNIVLEDTSGHRYDLAQHSAGKVVLTFFGYTHCPDECPTMMADVAQALRESSATVRSHVDVVFVTVDPARDSATAIRRWLDRFNRSFIGLRGSTPVVGAIQRALGLPASHVFPHTKHGYVVEHSSELLAITPDHRVHEIFIEGPTTIGDIRHDMAVIVEHNMYGA